MDTQILMPKTIQAKADEIMARNRRWPGATMMTQGAPENEPPAGGQQSLLDQAADQGGAGGQGGDGSDAGAGGQQGGQGGQQGGQGQQVDVNAIVTQVVAAVTQQFDSVADRRVNAILREMRENPEQFVQQHGAGGGGNGGQQDQGGQPNGGGQGGNQGGGQQGGGSGGGSRGGRSNANESNAREARLVYRDYVGDAIKFTGNEEREHATLVANAVIQDRLRQGEDPETAGRTAAREVSDSLKTLRKHYEGAILGQLRRNGQIQAAPGGHTQPVRGGVTPDQSSGYQKGAAAAQRLAGNRMPQNQQ